MWRMLERMAKGDSSVKDINLLSDVTKQIEGHYNLCIWRRISMACSRTIKTISEKK